MLLLKQVKDEQGLAVKCLR